MNQPGYAEQPGDATREWEYRAAQQGELRWQVLDRRTQEMIDNMRWLRQEELPRMRETWQRSVEALLNEFTALERRVTRAEAEMVSGLNIDRVIWHAALVVSTAIVLAGVVMGVTLFVLTVML